MCCIHFPAGKFRPEYFVQYKYNAHLLLVFVLYLFFWPEYSVKYKYNTNVLLLYLNCIYIYAPEYSVKYKYNTIQM